MVVVRRLDLAMLCPAGFESVVALAAARELPKFAEASRTSGFIRGRTVASVNAVRAFPCATNVFEVIDSVPRTTVDREARLFASRLDTRARPVGLPKRGTFRLRIHDDGTFSSTSTALGHRLERAMSSWAGLEIARRSGSVELWLIRRADEPISILAVKLTAGRPQPPRGVLRPEICAALARVEPLAGHELVLDPFAGSGAIGKACVEAGAGRVWLNDIQPGGAHGTQASSGVFWTHRDFRTLEVVPGSISTVVTDPPWGHYASIDEGLDELYADLGSAAGAWLRPGGALVLLTGAPESSVRRLVASGDVELETSLPVLVNGRKASVVRARTPNRLGRRPAPRPS